MALLQMTLAAESRGDRSTPRWSAGKARTKALSLGQLVGCHDAHPSRLRMNPETSRCGAVVPSEGFAVDRSAPVWSSRRGGLGPPLIGWPAWAAPPPLPSAPPLAGCQNRCPPWRLIDRERLARLQFMTGVGQSLQNLLSLSQLSGVFLL